MDLKDKFNKQKFIESNGDFAINKLKDFLLSEIDEATLKDINKFLESKNGEEKNLLKKYLYNGDKYKGILLDGNQYLIKKEGHEAIVIDSVSEEYSNDFKYTRFKLRIEDFIYVINHKNMILKDLS
ncbi:hypothetical protein QUF88_17025 [Bacillus sp. DX1.1]|uniref:hypothetical protein n=1 Tax=unclassified Bacillus (in: firmicutes) TaxID=185979 RepID=UPI0025700897|nr:MULTISPECIES: hypothetical protein [unclassified Bacillus (in: firmicutes)]MDM5155446.1 hypothetical protein [Bacillus sp. DX1.1]WJE79759.1 hypothetical protein QRE67_14550 [Bacillus sp. DX3.1]